MDESSTPSATEPVTPAGMPDPTDEAALMAWAKSPEGIATFQRMSDHLVATQGAPATPGQGIVQVKIAPAADATST